MEIRYSVGADHPLEHRARFTVHLDRFEETSIDVVFPSWVPGSYNIRAISRNVREVAASAGTAGTPVPVERIDKARWRVTVGTARPLRFDYVVYGYDGRNLATASLDVTDEHLFLNAALCLPYVEGHKEEPTTLELHVPAEWKIYTELKEVERHPPTYRAEDYDELVDSPVDCGQPTVLSTRARGIEHRIVLCGSGGNYEPHRLEADLAKIGEAAARLYGTLPFERYTYFFHLTDRRTGGLEHKTGTAIGVPRTIFRPETDYQGFLRLCSHEYIHLFNVKRIRPKVLGPFDYTKEVYTHQLWWMEGTTDYYAPLLLRRAGLTTPAKYLEGVAKEIRRYQEIPGRLVTSLEEGSFASWIDLYHGDEESVNRSVSYYLKGSIVSLGLDLEIRHRTENAQSLDTVMRALWTEYGAKDRGLEEGEIRDVAERVTKLDLHDYFRRYIAGTDEIDFAPVFAHAGLSLTPVDPKPEPGDDLPGGYLGLELEAANGLARITSVRDGSPGRRAGLSPGDEIVALDGSRVAFDQFPAVLKRYPPGSSVDVALFRRGFLRHVPATTGEALPEKLKLAPVEAPSALARAIYEGWVEAPWTPPKPSETPSPSR